MNPCILPVIEEELHWKELPVDWKVEGVKGYKEWRVISDDVKMDSRLRGNDMVLTT